MNSPDSKDSGIFGEGGKPQERKKKMSQILDAVQSANRLHIDNFGAKGKLPMPPARHLAILTCMDARLDPAKFAGLQEGDAHVIRNAGGRATDDAIRSLIISYKLLGTREWMVIHHTDCGMETFTDEVMRSLLAKSLNTAKLLEGGWQDVSDGTGSTEGEFIDWLTIQNHAKDICADVSRIRNHPLVPKTIPIYGYIYDVKTGRLQEVPEAMELGRCESSKFARTQKA
jgi:carbonic anhydrase